MDEEINEYEKYLLDFGVVEKPQMPKFDVETYTDSKYLSTVYEVMEDFNDIDDEYLTIQHLKGY